VGRPEKVSQIQSCDNLKIPNKEKFKNARCADFSKGYLNGYISYGRGDVLFVTVSLKCT